jgi:long-subunit acyl-CoA synthetase (AMP-forming)
MSPELSGFRQRITDLAAEHPDACALWSDDLKLSYAELDAEINLRQQRLKDLDARVVALALENGPDLLIWDLAILFAGLACVTLPPFFSAAQRRHCLEQSQADVVIAGDEYADELAISAFRHEEGFWLRTNPQPSPLPVGTAKLTFTSGTTGTPKGVCLDAASVLAVAMENVGCYAALYAGAMLSLPSQRTLGIEGASGVELPRLLSTLAARQPHSMILVPQLLLLLVSACEMNAFNPAALRFIAVGGAKVTHELLLRAETLGIPARRSWPSTAPTPIIPAASANPCPMCRYAWPKTARS